jgi:hypothetical protein
MHDRLRKSCFMLAGLLILTASTIHAQSTIRGQVIDAMTTNPIVGATVTDTLSGTGVITDEEGRFSLQTQGERVTLQISFLGYQREFRTIRTDTERKLVFPLRPTEIELPTTTITDGKLMRLYPDKSVQIRDFEFLDDHLLVIVYDPERKRNRLELWTNDMEFLTDWDHAEDPPLSLERDCLHNVQCISRTHAGQVDYAMHQLVLRRDSLHIYRQAMESCRALLDSTFFFGYSPSRFTRSFVYVRADERRKRHLYASMDTNAVTTIKDEMRMSDKIVSPELMYSPARGNQAKAFQDGMNSSYLYTVQFPEPYVPIRTVAGTACVFDHPRRKLLRFDAYGRKVGETGISYPDMRRWQRVVLVDHEQRRAFTLSAKSGYTSLHQIDLDTGELSRTWELPLPFVQKVRVRGNYIYFLYRDKEYDPVKRLYRFEM